MRTFNSVFHAPLAKALYFPSLGAKSGSVFFEESSMLSECLHLPLSSNQTAPAMWIVHRHDAKRSTTKQHVLQSVLILYQYLVAIPNGWAYFYSPTQIIHQRNVVEGPAGACSPCSSTMHGCQATDSRTRSGSAFPPRTLRRLSTSSSSLN